MELYELEESEIDLDYARLLDVHVWSDYPEVNSFINKIHDQYLGTEFRQDRSKRQLKVLLLSLYVNWVTDPCLLTAYSRTLSDYRKGTRYNKLHITRTVIDISDRLIEVGLLNLKLGYPGSDDWRGKNSKIWPTRLLVEEFKKAKFNRFYIGSDISGRSLRGDSYATKRPTYECLILRDEKKNDLEYRETKTTERIRKVIEDYRNLMKFHHVSLSNADRNYIEVYQEKTGLEGLGFDPLTGKLKYQAAEDVKPRASKGIQRLSLNHNPQIRRIFNNSSWRQGGRWYGGFWQNIPSAYRRFIRINNQRTIEIDYSALHPVLMYAKVGINYWLKFGFRSDPYDLEADLDRTLGPKAKGTRVTIRNNLNDYSPYWERHLIKLLVLVATNAKSEKAAFAAVKSELSERSEKQYNLRYTKLTNQLLKGYLEAIKLKHDPIASYFGANKSHDLMYQDSQITERIIKKFIDIGAPILCIHDSYIVQEDYQIDLLDLMRETWNELSGLPEDKLREDLWGEKFPAYVKVKQLGYVDELFDHEEEGGGKEHQAMMSIKENEYVSKRHLEDWKIFKDVMKEPSITEERRSLTNINEQEYQVTLN